MLFGHQSDNNKPADQPVNNFRPTAAPAQNPLAVDPATGASLPASEEDTFRPAPQSFTPRDPAAPAPAVSAAAPASDASTPFAPDDDPLGGIAATDDLLALKQDALQQLGPLVDHLDQSPEEKFRTTMMMIQSADNQALIPVAYKAAQAIGDEKARAQALLDIVNEINYFTQKGA